MKIAIFGLGSIGQRHARNLAEMGEADILGCDTRVGTEGFVTEGWVQAVSDAELVWQWGPNVVLICTPPPLHAELALTAFRHGAHCFVEKPVADTLVDAQLIRDSARHYHRIVAVGYQLREQVEQVPRGKDLTWECSQDMSLWPSRYPKDALLEFSHEIDAACFVNGPATSVWAEDDSYGWTIHLRHFSCTSRVLINPHARTSSRGCYADGRRVWKFEPAQNDQAYKDYLATFLQATTDPHKGMDNLCTGPQAAHVLRIIEACQRSQQNYEVVQL